MTLDDLFSLKVRAMWTAVLVSFDLSSKSKLPKKIYIYIDISITDLRRNS